MHKGEVVGLVFAIRMERPNMVDFKRVPLDGKADRLIANEALLSLTFIELRLKISALDASEGSEILRVNRAARRL